MKQTLRMAALAVVLSAWMAAWAKPDATWWTVAIESRRDAPPKPVDAPLLATEDTDALLERVGCVKQVGAYKPQAFVVEGSSPDRQWSGVKWLVDTAAIATLGWQLTPKPSLAGNSDAVWVSAALLDHLGIASLPQPQVLQERVSVIGAPAGERTLLKPVPVGGSVRTPYANAVVVVQPVPAVLHHASTRYVGAARVQAALPPTLVLRMEGDTDACLARLQVVLDQWSARAGQHFVAKRMSP